MTEHPEDANTSCVDPLPVLHEATPPLAPALMPRQTLVLWTPRLMLAATMRALSEFRRPQAVLPATVAVPNADEPR
jgi:hypothetical protein